MSKAIGAFVQKAKALSGSASKFTPGVADGNRILPSKSKDAEFQCRIDAGRYDPATQKLNVVLQINSQAKSPALRDWARKRSTHDKLATEAFDTAAKDKTAELDRVLESLEAQAKSKLG
ncbi:hypothetical protein BU23DRAFT_561891 [Bimuria novae-zelandiae CBS 107.79]|uniref:Uncharacterized protein n=1 Tax=Bimuria novae-zelandiae CBS 107.79 TaxID=1447943 RepID=A0A6A5UNK4_9PLEO|nr:hypothetical protein BU23DRAFT_561891 [Bimuria novae-zelandiae CBS 107.79]